MTARTIAIGDIHGGLKGLEQVISKTEATQNDTFIFLGDLVDGWSDSAATVSYLITLDQQYNCIFIKGNHDYWCEQWLKTGIANPTWLQHGGQSTYDSYKDLHESVKQQHLTFFEKMQNYYIDSENRLFIHAGFTSMHGPEKEFYTSNYNWDRTLWEMALTMNYRIADNMKIYPKRLLLFKEIFIGHTPTLLYDVTEPMQGCNVWNIDTGAAFTGKLTAMNIDTKEFWQSDTLTSLYPNEKGRNK
ncbi:metallophosphoesterase family protein [Flavobacterium cerinum]|uniref:Serine/threonine protein phosphatase n=1 Tax=Flavobacterium cerinum TaxID=2502784 RepID=A0ABY5J0C7_9FLAO|nr:metallophosphoesterase family protein [Flavobacterium cerinum]UUC47211.1 serine/threonine protein phosphatase [Flavobacterium cerinum]